jgi:hypothetical protein
MTSIAKLAPIVVRAANEPHPSDGGLSQQEYAEGANLEGTPLVFAKSTDTSCHIDPAIVRMGMDAIELAANNQ